MNDAKAFLAPEESHPVTLNPRPDSTSTGLSAKAVRWIEENRAAIDEYNEWYARNGSPLDRFRSF